MWPDCGRRSFADDSGWSWMFQLAAAALNLRRLQRLLPQAG
jgi:hypothetical protein